MKTHVGDDRRTIVAGFAKQGCWLTCHNGDADAPKQATTAEVQANPLLSALKKNDVRKYLRRRVPTRWRRGHGKSLDEIAKIKAAGGFLDLIQWRAHRFQSGRHGGRRLRARVSQF